MVRVMAHIGSGVEYGLHCLLWLVGPNREPASSRDLADLQGVSASFVAKIFAKLQKAGIVTASEGLRGGYRLGRPAEHITVLDVVDAIEGEKPLFDCQQIRGRCAVFGGKPPAWSTNGVCGIHAVMLRAERTMRDELGRTTIADLVRTVANKASADFPDTIQGWLAERMASRKETQGPVARDSPRRRRR